MLGLQPSGDHRRYDLASAPCGPAVRCRLGHFLSLCKQSSFRFECSQVDGQQSGRFGVLIRKGEALLGLFIVVNCQDRVLYPVLPGYSTQQATQETPKGTAYTSHHILCVFPRYVPQKVSPPGFTEYLSSVPICDSSQSGPLHAGHHVGSTT